MEESRARAVIEQAGFRVGGVIYKQSKSRAGTVIQQWPNAGTPWEPGTRINLTVSGYIVK